MSKTPSLRLSVLATAALLAGCSLVPKYERPAAPVPTAFPTVSGATAPAAAEGQASAPVPWEQFFTDARLQRLVRLALENNRDLRVAVLNLEQARAQFQIRRADQFPTVNAAANASRGNSQITGDIVNNFQVGLAVSAWELDFFGRIASLKEQALAQYLASDEGRKATELSLVASVANGWLTLLADDSWQLVLNDAYGYLNKRYRHELYGFYKESLFKRYPFSAKSDSDVAIADFREFFKADGVADAFVDRYLKAFVSDSEGKYQLRRLDGQGLPLSPVFLAQMNRTQVIRRSFFAENPAEPLVLFKLEPFALDYSVNRADFQFGGQQLEYRHGPIIASAFRWPAEGENERSSLVLEEQGGRRVGIGKDSGPWALFRLLDQMQVEQHSGRDVLLLKANLSGLQAKYLLHSQRSPNPFDASLLRQFKLPATL